MKEESVFPRLENCPKCGARLKTIRYGLHAGPPNWDEIDAGCAFDENAPTKACDNCEWRGGNGGRTWETSWLETWEVPIDDGSGKMRSMSREFDLESMSDIELIECGESMLIPRYELVFRGYSPESVDQLFDERDAPSFPLLEKEIMFVHYNPSTKLIEQASNFHAHRMNHMFLYLRPGFSEWDSVIVSADYEKAIQKFTDPELEIWEIDLSIEYNADGEEGEWQHYGIPELKVMLAGEPLEPNVLASTAKRFKRSIPLPRWFEPGLMLRENARFRRN